MKLRSPSAFVGFLLLGGVLLLAAFRREPASARYERSLNLGQRDIAIVRDFVNIYPDASHFMSYYTAEYGPPTWNTKVGIGGRYCLVMKFKISISPFSQAVTKTSEATFYLNEVTSVSKLSDGRYDIHYGRNIEFDESRWNDLKKAIGDIGIFGVEKPIAPIPLFDAVKDVANRGLNQARMDSPWGSSVGHAVHTFNPLTNFTAHSHPSGIDA